MPAVVEKDKKVKVQVTLDQATKVQSGSRVVVQLFL